MGILKAITISLVTILLTIRVTAQQTQKTPVVQHDEVKLLTSADTLQYTLGAFIGQWIVTNGFSVTEPILFNRGIDDVLHNIPLAVKDSSVVQRIAAYQVSMQNERNRQLEEQLFTALRGKPGVGALPDGVHYLVVKAGTGLRPIATDTVVIDAVGIFPDGTVFEDTYKKKQAITTVVGKLIPGLNETIQLMPQGSVWRIFVPSSLAYGPAGLANVIPANMALVFDITLEEVKKGSGQ